MEEGWRGGGEEREIEERERERERITEKDSEEEKSHYKKLEDIRQLGIVYKYTQISTTQKW